MTEKNSLFIGLTETWLSHEHETAELCLDGYDVIRQDRVGRECGGVALLVRDDLTAEPILSFSNDGCEVLVVPILQLNLICSVVYRPPCTQYFKFKEVIDKLNVLISDLTSPIPDIVLIGDFNFNSRDVAWKEDDDGDQKMAKLDDESEMEDGFEDNPTEMITSTQISAEPDIDDSVMTAFAKKHLGEKQVVLQVDDDDQGINEIAKKHLETFQAAAELDSTLNMGMDESKENNDQHDITVKAASKDLNNGGVKCEKCDELEIDLAIDCLLYTSPSPRDLSTSRMPSSA
mgnify:CR=1 FL=1